MVGVYYPAYWESDAASVAEWRAKDPENRKNTFIIPQNDKTAKMEPMSTYVKDLAEYPDGVIAKYDFDDASTQNSVGLYSLAVNLTIAKPLTIMPERVSATST